jgi:hypothetical protein
MGRRVGRGKESRADASKPADNASIEFITTASEMTTSCACLALLLQLSCTSVAAEMSRSCGSLAPLLRLSCTFVAAEMSGSCASLAPLLQLDDTCCVSSVFCSTSVAPLLRLCRVCCCCCCALFFASTSSSAISHVYSLLKDDHLPSAPSAAAERDHPPPRPLPPLT